MIKHSTKNTVALMAAVGMWVGWVTSADAAYQWVNATQNGNEDLSGQLRMTITQGPRGDVDFTFRNSGPINSAITGIYFDYDNTIASQLGMRAGDLTVGANWLLSNTGQLGSSYAPVALLVRNAGVMTGRTVMNGIGESADASGYDWLTLRFVSGSEGLTLADLEKALSSGELRVGLQLQSFGTRDFYLTAPVPEPTTILAGLFLLVPFALSTVRFLLRKPIG